MNDLWQEATIAQLVTLFTADEDVRAVLLYGSCAREDIQRDDWSDVDLAVVVTDAAMAHFCLAADWLSPIGELYASYTCAYASFIVLSTVFTDGRRIDFKLIYESALARKDAGEPDPFIDGGRLLFSRSPAVDNAPPQPYPPAQWVPYPAEAFVQLCNTFRFTAVCAVTKAARNELLVAAHLSLDLARTCLQLGMHLRDRATGANIHRDGTHGNDYVAQLASLSQPFTQQGLLEMIAQSACAFDDLANQWASDYQPCQAPLLAMIEKARRSISEPSWRK